MKRNFEDVCRTEDFQELSVEDVEDLISSDNIYVQTEETVVEAIQLWLSKDTNLRQQHVQRLIQHVKLTNLSTDSVSKLVQNNMITSNEKLALEEDGLTVKSRSWNDKYVNVNQKEGSNSVLLPIMGLEVEYVMGFLEIMWVLIWLQWWTTPLFTGHNVFTNFAQNLSIP